MKHHEWVLLTGKLDKWLAGTAYKGSIQLYEHAKGECRLIANNADEYEILIKYLNWRIKV